MSKAILMLDNYDSFTYNLVHYLEGLDQEVVVIRNDALSVNDALAFSRIVFSPGPGVPKDAGIMPQLLQKIVHQHILGICLGHQAIGEAFGGHLHNLEEVQHGVPGQLEMVKADPIFNGISAHTEVGRYHSWVIKNPLPAELELLALEKSDRSIMAIKHRSKSIYGLQFHPESVLTPQGKKMLENWLTITLNQ